MTEFFILSNSFAAPFFSDQGEDYVKARTSEEAMKNFRNSYDHPAGLYSAAVFKNADAYHKGQKALLIWLSPKARKDSKEG